MRVGKEEQIKSLVTILKRFHKHKGNSKVNIIKGNIKKSNDQSSKSQIKKQYQPINSVRLYQQSAKNNKTQVDEIKKILCVEEPSQEDSLSHKNSIFLFETINNKSKNINPRTDLTSNQIVMGEHARRYGIFYRQNGQKNDKGKQIQNDSFLSTHKPRIKSQVTESIFYKKSKEFKNLGVNPMTNSIIRSPKNSPILIECQYSGKYSKSKKNKSPLTPTLGTEMLSVPLGLNKSSTPGLNRYSPLNSKLRMNNYQKYCQSIYQKYRDKSNQKLERSYKIYDQSYYKSEFKNKTRIFYTEQHKKTVQRNKRNIKIWQLNQNPLDKIKNIDLTKRSSKKGADQWLKNIKQQNDNKNLQQVFVDSFNTSQLKPMLPQKVQKDSSVSHPIKQKFNKRYERTTPKLYTQLPSDSLIKSKNKTEKPAEKHIYIETEIKLEGWQQNRRNNLPYVGKFNFDGSRANSTSMDHNYEKNSLFC